MFSSLGVRIRATLADIDPLNQVPFKGARSKLRRVPFKGGLPDAT